MQLVRDFWLLRKLSSIVYEAQLSLNGFVPKIEVIKTLVDNGTRPIERKGSSGKYLQLANNLRNKSTYHYGVSELVNNIEGFDAKTKHTYYAHEHHGNSISALCEQIVTLPTINQSFTGANVDDFHLWCRTSSNSILHFCNVAIAKIVSNRFPDKVIEMKEVILRQEAEVSDHRWPMCLVVEQTHNIL